MVQMMQLDGPNDAPSPSPSDKPPSKASTITGHFIKVEKLKPLSPLNKSKPVLGWQPVKRSRSRSKAKKPSRHAHSTPHSILTPPPTPLKHHHHQDHKMR